MILAIDIGNTNIDIGCLEGEEVLFSERLSNACRTELEYILSIRAFLELYGVNREAITGAAVSSVAPQVTVTAVRALTKFLGVKPIQVGPGVKTGLHIVTDNPAQVGADMICNAVAGLRDYGAPLVIIDMGTATTFSVIDENGKFTGTIILPGIGTSLDALTASAAQLPRISIEAPRRVVGRNTVDSMKSGAVFGQAAAIDGLLDRIERELGYDVTAVATGGAAESVIACCEREIVYDSALTLKGLGLIYRRNEAGEGK